MSRGKQSVRKGVWYIGGKYKRAPKRKKQKGGAIPFGLIASLAGPGKYWEEEDVVILKNGKTNCHFKKKSKSKSSKFTKWKVFYIKMGVNKQKIASNKYKGKKTKNNWSKRK